MASEAVKEPSSRSLRYMARYDTEKPQICQLMGQRNMEIYLQRGFVVIDKEEFERIWKIKREELL